MDHSSEVRELIKGILEQVQFPGRDELLLQTRDLFVRGGPITMLDLGVKGLPAPSDCPDGPAPFRALVKDGDRDASGELLMWVKGGLIEGLEHAWWSEEPPQALPTLDQVLVDQT